jgi:hypothetical protein
MQLHDSIVHKFLDDCFSSGIKDPVRFLTDKMPRVYGFLRGAFPRGILPTDVDGEVEINGYFLRLEFKHENCLRDGRIPKGQSLAFSSLITTGKFTIFYIGHNTFGGIELMHVWGRRGRTIVDPCNEEILRDYCKMWAVKADAKDL